MVDGATTHVGVALIGGGVGVGSADELGPEAFGGGGDAGADPVADVELGGEAAAVVVYQHVRAGGEAAGLRVGGVEGDPGLARSAAQFGVVAEDRVQEMVGRGGDQRQRIPG